MGCVKACGSHIPNTGVSQIQTAEGRAGRTALDCRDVGAGLGGAAAAGSRQSVPVAYSRQRLLCGRLVCPPPHPHPSAACLLPCHPPWAGMGTALEQQRQMSGTLLTAPFSSTQAMRSGPSTCRVSAASDGGMGQRAQHARKQKRPLGCRLAAGRAQGLLPRGVHAEPGTRGCTAFAVDRPACGVRLLTCPMPSERPLQPRARPPWFAFFLEGPPKVLHYGILWNVSAACARAGGRAPASRCRCRCCCCCMGADAHTRRCQPVQVTRGAVPEDFQFDKHWFEQFDALSCPPWQLRCAARGANTGAGAGLAGAAASVHSSSRCQPYAIHNTTRTGSVAPPLPACCSQDPHRSTQGLFPHPPPPSQLNRSSGYAYLRDLLSIEVSNH